GWGWLWFRGRVAAGGLRVGARSGAPGDRSRAAVRTHFSWRAAEATDLLERATDSTAVRAATPGSEVEVELRPFELLTLRFRDPAA
ncbi:hypothetical protein, partial [Streptomyces olivaceus]|uniref:hypothetical protein n=1 Tax=Streptomyces olivaceus TaxID=47716 RepID=UPI00365CB17E